ncbi:MAG: iron ABC transporter permease [Verrucomicrobiales bacterium]
MAVAAVALAPPAVALVGLGKAGPEWAHIAETVLWTYCQNTLILALGAGILVLLLAIPPAWLVATREFPGRRIFEWALILPLAFPTYVAALCYLSVPEALIPWLVEIRLSRGVDAFLFWESASRYALVSLVLASVLYPYVFLTARTAFAGAGKAMVESSQMLGRGMWATFFRVALPLARPATIAGLSLVIMEVVNDYGAVNLLGVPTLTEGIFRTWGGLEDRASAVRLAGIVTVAILAMLAAERLQRGRRTYDDPRAEAGGGRLRLGRLGGAVAMAVCLLPLALGFLYPAGRLLHWAWLTGGKALGSDFLAMAGRSAALSLAAAAAVALAGLLMAYAGRCRRSRWLDGTLRLATIGYAIPGAVVAVGVMVIAGAVDRHAGALPVALGGTLIAIAIGYGSRFLAVAYHPIRSGMEQLCRGVDDASRMLGAGRGRTLLRVTLPLVRRPLLAAAMLVFIDILKELPLTMILRPADFETLATKAFGLAKEGRIHESAAPSLLIAAAGIAGLIPLNRLLRRGTRDTLTEPRDHDPADR